MAAPTPAPHSVLSVFFLEKLGYTPAHLAIDAFEWLCVLFLIAGPLVSSHMDAALTRMCNKMAGSWAAAIVFGVGILLWVFELWVNYRKAHADKFDLEYQLDAEQARAPRPWIEEFRLSYRKRQFLSLVVNTVLICCVICYYEIWIAFTVLARRHIGVMKASCTGSPLTFRFLEKIYLQQWVKDLPFSTGELINLYGKCPPDTDVYAVKAITSLANSLHWFLILFLVGFLWRKQIRTWFFPAEGRTA